MRPASAWNSWIERLPTYRIAGFVFLRALGLVYACAFISLWVQVNGLIGSRGIFPIATLMEQARGHASFFDFPTLCWISSSDLSLHLQCAAGVGLSLALIAGLAPGLSAALLWLLYLSLSVAGQRFLSYQWDALLLEAGLLAVWIAPLRWVSRWSTDPPPSRLAVFLVHALLFKLMFLSGYVKLAGGDVCWRDLTALTYHYWTTCLPTWTGWYADKLPLWFQKTSCALMFGIELGLPFLIWGPGRWTRWFAFSGLVGLQVLIWATGNYTFFNLLTMTLCVMILDDRCFGDGPAQREGRAWPTWAVAAVAIPILAVSLMIFSRSLRWNVPWPRSAVRIYQAVQPFRSVNGYGLFAHMTKSRTEIILEGSDDGVTWKAYEFKWKPGDPARRPRFVAPHQPRVDWEMWFAALSTYQHQPWFMNFMVRLLEGSPPVLDLLAHNPFPEHPPRYLRASAYAYRFSTSEERRRDGTWWTREPRGLYCPPVALNRSSP